MFHFITQVKEKRSFKYKFKFQSWAKVGIKIISGNQHLLIFFCGFLEFDKGDFFIDGIKLEKQCN